jgi:DNA-binding response OmpR family regulator
MRPRVAIYSVDAMLSDLLARNLARRGFGVRQAARTPCCDHLADLLEAADVVIADLDCPAPACWQGVARLREQHPSLPVVFLAHDRPDAGRLRAWRPYRYLRKPLAVDELLRVLAELVPAGSRAQAPAGSGTR